MLPSKLLLDYLANYSVECLRLKTVINLHLDTR